MPKFLSNIDLVNNELQNAKLQQLAADPTGVEGLVYYNTATKQVRFYNGTAWINLGRLDQISAPTAAVALNGQKITGLADGTAATDAATKGQVDAAQAGLDAKASVRVATTAAGTLATSFANGQVVDGVTLVTGNRILIKNQAAGAENGIYTVNASGAPTRATDADTSAKVNSGLYVFVEEGTANDNTGWVLTTNDPITLATTALAFSKFTATAAGLSRYAANVGDGSSTSIVVTHNLGTADVHVQVYRVASPLDQVFPDIQMTSTNTITLIFATAPAAAAFRVVVIG